MGTPHLKTDPPIVGSSRTTRRLIEHVAILADTSANVLVSGESGTGKELVARNLHNLSSLGGGPFVPVNCAALSPGILESELFGHGRGAFTGAVQAHAGLFEQADGGTLFLDEIGEIPLYFQAKLLRVIQDREVRRMGAESARKVDVRIISATNADLDGRVSDGTFRLDLLYRLNVIEVRVAPLRERADDVFDLIDHFFRQKGCSPPLIPEETRALFTRHRWPGNVRELENEVERILALYKGAESITPAMLSPRIVAGGRPDGLDVRLLYDAPLAKAVGYLEENRLRKTLVRTNWNKSRSARILGLSRQGLLKKIKRYGIAEAESPDGTAPDGSDS